MGTGITEEAAEVFNFFAPKGKTDDSIESTDKVLDVLMSIDKNLKNIYDKIK